MQAWMWKWFSAFLLIYIIALQRLQCSPFHPHSSAAPLETATKLCCLHWNPPAGSLKQEVGQLNFSFMLLSCYGMKWKHQGCQSYTSIFWLSLTKPTSHLLSLPGGGVVFPAQFTQQPSFIAAPHRISSSKVLDDEVWSVSLLLFFVVSLTKFHSKKKSWKQ